MSYQSTCILFPLIPWLLCHAQILCRTRRCNSMLGRSTPLLRQKLSTTSFLTLAAAALSKSAVLKWMRPKDCQKQQKAISILYHVFKHIQLSTATAIFFLSMNDMQDHQFLFWAGRWYVGRRRWSQKCGTCQYLKRHTVETKMIHVGSCLEHWLVILVRWNCGCMHGCSCSAITSKLFLCIFLILCNSMQSSPSMQAAVIPISL